MGIVVVLLTFLISGVVIYHSFLIALAIAVWFAIVHGSVIVYLLHNPASVAAYAACYLLIGAVWSVIKWWFAETAKARKAKDRFASHEWKQSWEEFTKHDKTIVAHYTSDIAIWIGFWPFSAVWTLLDDPLRRLVRRIALELRGVYQRITDRAWKSAV